MPRTDMTLVIEKEIIRDLYHYLRDHDDPPAAGAEGCTDFWMKASEDISHLVGRQWNNHPLAVGLGCAVYGYLEMKCKTKSKA